jgi:hypothetical protein
MATAAGNGVTAQERFQILQMLKDGRIDPEAAAQLLDALGEGKTAAPVEESSLPPEEITRQPRWLRVRVTDTDTGRPRVNVRLPVSLVNMGLKIGARYAPEIEGVDMVALLHAAQAGQSGAFVDVYDEEEGEHVEVFLE